jgi:amino acid permease
MAVKAGEQKHPQSILPLSVVEKLLLIVFFFFTALCIFLWLLDFHMRRLLPE